MTAPSRKGPKPADFATGLGTWAAYVAFRRSKRPARWVLKHLRRALFGWSDYLRYLREQSVVEGVFGGRKIWLVLGAGLWGTRALRRAVARSERIVLNEVVQPGDRIVITQLPRKAPRKERRAARRAS